MQVDITVRTKEQAEALAAQLNRAFYPHVLPQGASVSCEDILPDRWNVSLKGVRHVVGIEGSLSVYAGPVHEDNHFFIFSKDFGVVLHGVSPSF